MKSRAESSERLPGTGGKPSADAIVGRVRRVLSDCAGMPASIDTLADGDNLYEAGMTSRAGVSVMLGLEREFDVEFPDELLRRDVFESIDAIARAVASLEAEDGG